MYRGKGVEYNRKGEVTYCIFCKIHDREAPGNIVYQNSRYVVFSTHLPVTKCHLLVTPRRHIQNINSFTGLNGAKLLYNLKQIGILALRKVNKLEEIKARFCFHIPPHNSIDHLHLHAILNPESMTNYNKRNYNEDNDHCISVDKLMLQICPTIKDEIKNMGGDFFYDIDI